jgi:hypothetical protein
MSYPYSGSASDRYEFRFEFLASRNGESLDTSHTTDDAIDIALRGIPLPNGLMTRLGKLAYTVFDESADQVDYLGC